MASNQITLGTTWKASSGSQTAFSSSFTSAGRRELKQWNWRTGITLHCITVKTCLSIPICNSTSPSCFYHGNTIFRSWLETLAVQLFSISWALCFWHTMQLVIHFWVESVQPFHEVLRRCREWLLSWEVHLALWQYIKTNISFTVANAWSNECPNSSGGNHAWAPLALLFITKRDFGDEN